MNSSSDKYLIKFPGGELLYLPREALILDRIKGRTITLHKKKAPSLMLDVKLQGELSAYKFKPECLTLYISNICNLNCTYCYIPQKELYPVDSYINESIVESGAQIVAKNCRSQNLPFVVGFHGGNEPLLILKKVESCLKICHEVASKENVQLLAYCTTNGVIPEKTAKWAAATFHGITLSWDGHPFFQNNFRKDKSGYETSDFIERTAKIFIQSQNRPKIILVRCTITSSSVERMIEITQYFKSFGVQKVEYYPVFQNRTKPIPDEMIPDPVKFVYHFIQAKSFGESCGIEVLFSGSRVRDYHGRFCSTIQDNLTITPDGYLTNCFQHTQNYSAQDNLFFYGEYDHDLRQLKYDHEKLGRINDIQSYKPTQCSNCFNQFHCSLGCPGICPFNDNFKLNSQPDCIKEKWLGLESLLSAAGYNLYQLSEPELNTFFNAVTYPLI